MRLHCCVFTIKNIKENALKKNLCRLSFKLVGEKLPQHFVRTSDYNFNVDLKSKTKSWNVDSELVVAG